MARVYKHRGCLIVPTPEGWLICDYNTTTSSLKEARNYVDKKLGGFATSRVPQRMEEDR